VPRSPRAGTPLGLAAAYAALVLYASLFPFEGWHWPPGQTLAALAVLRPSAYQDGFDIGSNIVGYVPLGALLTLAGLRQGRAAAVATLWALGMASALSYACELLQQFLPSRVPTLEDLGTNALGALLGALLAVGTRGLGLWSRGHAVRRRWFTPDATLALALLALWPLGLLFPTPAPLGLGQVGPRLREWLTHWLQGVPWAEAAHAMLAAPLPPTALRPLEEMTIVALGLLAPSLVAYTVVDAAWRRAIAAVGVLAVGVAGMTFSTLLNFGPAHALAWIAPTTLPGLVLGTGLSLLALLLSPRVVAGLGLVVLTALVAGVAQAPMDAYFAHNLQAWERGQFVRFHGLAQWVGWLWPFAALGWMFKCLVSRPGGGGFLQSAP
jgi:VanZ family protein